MDPPTEKDVRNAIERSCSPGIVPFGYRRGETGELVAHEAEQQAIREIVALRAQGKLLRAIADAVRAEGASGFRMRAWRAS